MPTPTLNIQNFQSLIRSIRWSQLNNLHFNMTSCNIDLLGTYLLWSSTDNMKLRSNGGITIDYAMTHFGITEEEVMKIFFNADDNDKTASEMETVILKFLDSKGYTVVPNTSDIVKNPKTSNRKLRIKRLAKLIESLYWLRDSQIQLGQRWDMEALWEYDTMGTYLRYIADKKQFDLFSSGTPIRYKEARKFIEKHFGITKTEYNALFSHKTNKNLDLVDTIQLFKEFVVSRDCNIDVAFDNTVTITPNCDCPFHTKKKRKLKVKRLVKMIQALSDLSSEAIEDFDMSNKGCNALRMYYHSNMQKVKGPIQDLKFQKKHFGLTTKETKFLFGSEENKFAIPYHIMCKIEDFLATKGYNVKCKYSYSKLENWRDR